MEKDNKKGKVNKKHTVVNFLSLFVLGISIIYFIVSLFFCESKEPITTLVNSLILVIFSICYVSVAITYKRNNKNLLFICNVLLIIFFMFGICNSLGKIDLNTNSTVIDFTNKELSYVVDWSTAKDIDINQVYEYSDLIDEYHVISQDVRPGTKLSKVSELNLAISEGASPYKEVIVPDMNTWDTDRVLKFIEDNHLSNVKVEFENSDAKENTVFWQSFSGTMKRNDELKLAFARGSDFDEVKLIDFTKMSKFRCEFYLKQYNLRYEFNDDFSKKIKKGLAMKQNIKPGTMVKTNDEKVIITLSKGKKINVPDLTKMDSSEVIKWVIENKLKLNFREAYDENVKEGKIISANKNKGDVVSEGTVIEIVISRGALKMKKFNSYSEFTDWANKYNIKYEEQHEFSDKVAQGEVISYSYNPGDAIKNNDTIKVVISDGTKKSVPDVTGMSKDKAASKLRDSGLDVSYVYKSSDSVGEGKVIRQSISAGSDVSDGTTVTLTISTGKAPASSNNNNGGSSHSTPTPQPQQPSTPQAPSCDTSKGSDLNINSGNTGAETKNMIINQNPNHKFSFNMVSACPNGDSLPGSVCNGAGLDGVWKNYCDTISITIVQ